ncbi:cation:dicarboxylase symporter family transporter, partial [Planococcus sp. SIMBA_160]
MTIMLLTTLGLPMEIVGVIAGIYRIIDMGHTSLNVTGDVVSTLCIARSENMIEDEQINMNKINDIKY